jgi:hypothetical protein
MNYVCILHHLAQEHAAQLSGRVFYSGSRESLARCGGSLHVRLLGLTSIT